LLNMKFSVLFILAMFQFIEGFHKSFLAILHTIQLKRKSNTLRLNTKFQISQYQAMWIPVRRVIYKFERQRWWATSHFGGQVKFEIWVAQGQSHHVWISETLSTYFYLSCPLSISFNHKQVPKFQSTRG
jgi:hypothetical protein